MRKKTVFRGLVMAAALVFLLNQSGAWAMSVKKESIGYAEGDSFVSGFLVPVGTTAVLAALSMGSLSGVSAVPAAAGSASSAAPTLTSSISLTGAVAQEAPTLASTFSLGSALPASLSFGDVVVQAAPLASTFSLGAALPASLSLGSVATSAPAFFSMANIGSMAFNSIMTQAASSATADTMRLMGAKPNAVAVVSSAVGGAMGGFMGAGGLSGVASGAVAKGIGITPLQGLAIGGTVGAAAGEVNYTTKGKYADIVGLGSTVVTMGLVSAVKPGSFVTNFGDVLTQSRVSLVKNVINIGTNHLIKNEVAQQVVSMAGSVATDAAIGSGFDSSKVGGQIVSSGIQYGLQKVVGNNYGGALLAQVATSAIPAAFNGASAGEIAQQTLGQVVDATAEGRGAVSSEYEEGSLAKPVGSGAEVYKFAQQVNRGANFSRAVAFNGLGPAIEQTTTMPLIQKASGNIYNAENNKFFPQEKTTTKVPFYTPKDEVGVDSHNPVINAQATQIKYLSNQ